MLDLSFAQFSSNNFMKKKTDEEICETINNNINSDTQQKKAAAKSVLSRALHPETKASKDAANQAIKKSLQANPTPIRKDRNKYITPELMEYIRGQLNNEDKSGKPWIYQYVDKVLSTAMKDPESKSGQLFSNFIFNKEDFLAHLDSLVDREKDSDISYKKYLIRQTLYDKQQQVFDNDIDNKMLIINSRRSGKTELMGRLLVKGLLLQDAHCVYINRNSSAAIRQIRTPLKTALDKIGLKCIKGSIENQEMHFENGSQLLILGNNNSADIDKLRGERISMCIMDECGHQRNIRQLIREVIGPALKDYGKQSLICMVGTPPRIPHTYVEEIWDNAMERGWKLYHWTFEDNPFIPDRDKVINDVCKEQGCTPESAFIQREYYGRMNIYDDDARLIKKWSFVTQTQLQQTIGNIVDYAYVGVDFGFEDKPAVLSFVCKNNRMYVVDEWSENHHGVVDVSNEIKRQYNNLKENYSVAHSIKVICDDNIKEAVWDLYSIYKIPNVFTAYKANKDLALDQLNDFFSSNKIVISDKLNNGSLNEDCQNTLWQRDEETDKILHEIDDDTWHPNALMATLYVSRCYANEVLNLVDQNKMAKNIVEAVKNGN